jgi:hypothetical protein
MSHPSEKLTVTLDHTPEQRHARRRHGRGGDHLAMHKGAALKKIGKNDRASQKRLAHPKKK